MEEILQNINTVPGVVGSLVCGADGKIFSHVFPPLFDTAIMEKASSVIADPSSGICGVSGAPDMVDLRYSEGRIIVKPMDKAYLLLLCTKSVNLQVLTISLNVAKNRLEALVGPPNAAPPVKASPVGSDSADPPATPEGLILAACRLANKNANSSFEQFGMVALTQTTAHQINAFFKTSSLKKIKVTNQASGISALFPVMVVNENDPSYDGKLILCAAIEKKLKASAGDSLLVDI